MGTLSINLALHVKTAYGVVPCAEYVVLLLEEMVHLGLKLRVWGLGR